MSRVAIPTLLLATLVFAAAGCSKPATNDADFASIEPGAAPAPEAAEPLEPLSYAEEQLVTELLLRKAASDRFVPGFRERSGRAFARWRSFREAEIAAIEARPGFSSQVAEMDRVVASGGGTDADLGPDALVAIFEEEGRAPEAQFSTPGGTWLEFVAALGRADRARALRCLTLASREAQRTSMNAIPDETMRATADAFVRFDLRDGAGTRRYATAYQKDGSTHEIVFERSWNGDWGIASY